MPFKLIALVLPLSLDAFAVSAALGVAGLSRRERWRLSLRLAGFEAVMPIVGFLAGVWWLRRWVTSPITPPLPCWSGPDC
jgi:putative Mn2+ efflux pump MntP